MKKMKIVGISGSLRKKTYNSSLLKSMEKFSLENIEFSVLDISDIPLFSEDLEGKNLPEHISDFAKKVTDADGVIFSTPEYNASFSGVVKNAIDWLSRNYEGVNPLVGKPVALCGVTMGGFGTKAAQFSLASVFVGTGSTLMSRPMPKISHGQDKFDNDGNLTDERIEEELKEFLQKFGEFIRKF